VFGLTLEFSRYAIIKLLALIDLCHASGLEDDSLEVRHLRSLLSYVEAH
jgi:hypothetical protein